MLRSDVLQLASWGTLRMGRDGGSVFNMRGEQFELARRGPNGVPYRSHAVGEGEGKGVRRVPMAWERLRRRWPRVQGTEARGHTQHAAPVLSRGMQQFQCLPHSVRPSLACTRQRDVPLSR